jgi:hypothetical protein
MRTIDLLKWISHIYKNNLLQYYLLTCSEPHAKKYMQETYKIVSYYRFGQERVNYIFSNCKLSFSLICAKCFNV